MDKAIVSLSGGMDSVSLLGKVLHENDYEIECVGFTYGSKHNFYENKAAYEVSHHYGVRYDKIDLSLVMAHLKSDLLKSGGEIPEGHYEAESMAATVVPGRNMIFASVLAAIASSRGARAIYLGVHSGDHAIYPDCRPEFIMNMKMTILCATSGRVSLKAPFIDQTKGSIIKYGSAIKVPYYLTRTCYKDQPIACGKCGSCQERLEGFAENGIVDPIEYESRVILPKE